MEQVIAEKLAAGLRIDTLQVVREYWEVVFLKKLAETPAGGMLVFKGGTALRLAYGSPRFSEDLDFSLSRDVLKGKFSRMLSGMAGSVPEAEITDVAEKHFTYLGEIKITQNFLRTPFRIKLEISKRIVRDYSSELKLITTPTSPLNVLCRVATLEQILKDKIECLKQRSKSKDVFDLWSISQKLKIPYSPPKTELTLKTLRRDLGKYLPDSYKPVIEELL